MCISNRSHAHTNRIETDQFRGFHIHMATERYQEIGAREDAYAEPTDRYSDMWGAFKCLLLDMNLTYIARPSEPDFLVDDHV